MIELTHDGFRSWDAIFTDPTFDFYFKVAIPKSRKGLGLVLRARQSDESLWLVANYPDGVSQEVADNLHAIVGEVIGD